MKLLGVALIIFLAWSLLHEKDVVDSSPKEAYCEQFGTELICGEDKGVVDSIKAAQGNYIASEDYDHAAKTGGSETIEDIREGEPI